MPEKVDLVAGPAAAKYHQIYSTLLTAKYSIITNNQTGMVLVSAGGAGVSLPSWICTRLPGVRSPARL